MAGLTDNEVIKLKTLCEFLFHDLYQYWATFSRFEIYFQPLFNNDEINLYEIFVNIVGEKKKYITFQRFVNSFLKYKYNRVKNINLIKFFDNLFNNILKGTNGYCGIHKDFSKNSEENTLCFSTKRIGLIKEDGFNDSFISKITVLSDRHERIRGIILEYDNINKYELYPKDISAEMFRSSEIHMDIIDRESFINYKKKYKDRINKSIFMDAVTHIFGTIEQTNHTISFLGFKCISGKKMFVGYPEGEPFLFGEFGKKFYNLRIEMKKEEGITLFEPGFIKNEIKNMNLNEINKYDFDKNEIEGNLNEEESLLNMEGDKLNQYITTSIIEDDIYFRQEEEELPGYDYKEVVNLKHRDWIKKNQDKTEDNYLKVNNLNDTKILYKTIIQKTLKKSTCIIQNDKMKQIYEYNPSQNPFFDKVDLPEYKIPYNPFFHSTIKKSEDVDDGLILHKTIPLIPKKDDEVKITFVKRKNNISSRKEEKFDGKINKDTIPRLFLNKINYNYLKEKLIKSIYDKFNEEFQKKYNKIGSLVPINIMKEFVPYEIDEREETVKKKIPEIKKELIINGVTLKYNKENDNNIVNQILLNINKNNIIYSDAAQLSKEIEYDFGQFRKIVEKNLKGKKYPENVYEKWKYLKNRLDRRHGRELLQIMRVIMKTLKIISNEELSKLELKNLIDYYKELTDEDNEKIIKFLTQTKKKEGFILGEKYIEDDEGAEEILMPDKYPEMNNSLTNLENTYNDLKTVLKNTHDKESKIPLKKLINYFNQQKNILIENITNKKKENLEDDNFRGNFLGAERKLKPLNIKSTIKICSHIDDQEEIEEKEINEKNTFHKQKIFKRDEDQYFKPNKNSLCPYEDKNKKWKLPEKVHNFDIENWEKIKWNKCVGIKIFWENGQPKLNNIRQGEYIGDCYFLSALGSLCSKDNIGLIKNMIKKRTKDKNSCIYFVKLNINGERKYVLVDNYFPIIINNNGEKRLCFGSSLEEELWVSILEKAWAKVSGCYANISYGGACAVAFNVLTDACVEVHQILRIDEDRKKKLWDELKKANDNKNVICAGTRHLGLGIWELITGNSGLISDHAYTILGIFDLKEYNLKLIKLRNPWGEKEFNGDWSDKSSLWDKKEYKGVKNKVGFTEVKDDGIFYMSFNDFLDYFREVEILKINGKFKVSKPCKIPKTEAYKCQLLKFEMNEDNKTVFINLYQKNPRIINKKGIYYPKPVKSFIILAKKEFNNNYIFIKSITNSKEHLGLEAKLKKGTYLIFCDVNYRFIYNEIYGYKVTIYSDCSGELNIENITNNMNGEKRSEILGKVLYNYYVSNQQQFIKIYTYDKKGEKIYLYRSLCYNEIFPFIVLLLKCKRGININKENIYFQLILNKRQNEKNACIYNDSEANEFQSYTCKKIKNDNTIILLMEYSLGEAFSFSYEFLDEDKIIEQEIFSRKYLFEKNIGKNILIYGNIVEKANGYILGIENLKEGKTHYNLRLNGLFFIDPKYDNKNKKNNNKKNDGPKIEINLSKKEKIVLYLRLNPKHDKFSFEFD